MAPVNTIAALIVCFASLVAGRPRYACRVEDGGGACRVDGARPYPRAGVLALVTGATRYDCLDLCEEDAECRSAVTSMLGGDCVLYGAEGEDGAQVASEDGAVWYVKGECPAECDLLASAAPRPPRAPRGSARRFSPSGLGTYGSYGYGV